MALQWTPQFMVLTRFSKYIDINCHQSDLLGQPTSPQSSKHSINMQTLRKIRIFTKFCSFWLMVRFMTCQESNSWLWTHHLYRLVWSSLVLAMKSLSWWLSWTLMNSYWLMTMAENAPEILFNSSSSANAWNEETSQRRFLQKSPTKFASIWSRIKSSLSFHKSKWETLAWFNLLAEIPKTDVRVLWRIRHAQIIT